jgi:hypothetical protein
VDQFGVTRAGENQARAVPLCSPMNS